MEISNNFDRLIGELDGLPEVTTTKPATIRNTGLFGMGAATLWVVQTFRKKENGDMIFLEHVSAEQTVRLVLPPAVADAIARQRDALTSKNRSKASKAVAEDRKARGEVPGFMKVKRGPGRPKGGAK